MTHFGILCPAASGHLNPMTTLGYELQQRGHRVTLIGHLDARPNALAAGLEFRAIGVAYTKQMALKPGDEFELVLGRKHIQLKQLAPEE